MSYRVKTFLIYSGLSVATLAIAAFLNIPRLYYPLFFCGVFSSLAIFHLLGLLLKKNWPQIYHSGIALLLALAGVILLYLLQRYRWSSESPEPVRLGILWLSQIQGAALITAIFAALDAQSDKISAIIAFLLAVSGLFFMGYLGIDDYVSKTCAASAVITIVCIVGEVLAGRLRG